MNNIRVALIGTPNVGKTSLFNGLTGMHQKIANYTGVTVEIREGIALLNPQLQLIDLPGLYSLKASSPEEEVSLNYLMRENPDWIAVVMDATHLESQLYLLMQILSLGKPVIGVLNKFDCLDSKALQVHGLSLSLGIPLIPTSALKSEGLEALIKALGSDSQKLHQPMVLKAWKKLKTEKDKQKWIHQLITPWMKSLHLHAQSSRLDQVLLHPRLGLLIFLVILLSLFQMTFWVGQYPVQILEWFFALLSKSLLSFSSYFWVRMLVEGVIGGVGSVLVFLPNILLMFVGIYFLEASGYMARAAFLLDHFMQKMGVQGKAFIPLMIGFGCNVPGMLALRTLENPKERLISLLVMPLMSCSARLSVYVLMLSAFFPVQWAGWILFFLYALGTGLAIAFAKFFRNSLIPSKIPNFLMEIPPLQWPSPRAVLMETWLKARDYWRNASTWILLASLIIWLFSNLHFETEFPYMKPVENLNQSITAQIGHALEPVIAPIGFDWKMGVALIAGFAAKEMMVSTMGTLYQVEQEDSSTLKQAMQADPHMNRLSVFSFLIFTLIYMPCVTTLIIFKQESKSLQLTFFLVFYTTALAYLMSLLVYQSGKFLGFLG